jgi:hypothetical protein
MIASVTAAPCRVQRGVTGAEVVDRDPDTVCAQRGEAGNRGALVDDRGLGDLQDEALRREPAAPEDRQDVVDERRVVQLPG